MESSAGAHGLTGGSLIRIPTLATKESARPDLNAWIDENYGGFCVQRADI